MQNSTNKKLKLLLTAGKIGAVTIATNMAGRGTDIVLGGNFDAIVANLKNQQKKPLLKQKKLGKQSMTKY